MSQPHESCVVNMKQGVVNSNYVVILHPPPLDPREIEKNIEWEPVKFFSLPLGDKFKFSKCQKHSRVQYRLPSLYLGYNYIIIR